MPELPEVETVARQLAARLPGKTILKLSVTDPKLTADCPSLRRNKQAVGRVIRAVYRAGKQIAIELAPAAATAPLWIVCHLRMTGRLIFSPAIVSDQGHLRASLLLDQGYVYFKDPRRFGTLAIFTDPSQFEPKGVDPLEKGFSAAGLHRMLKGSGESIKAWLLRQDRLVGMGNIYACESLFAACINPGKPAGDLTEQEVQNLYTSMRAILRKAIKHCGTTFSDFQDSTGSMGGYQKYLRVYGKRGQPCPACGGMIERIVQQQRSTFYCPRCQG